MTKPEKIMEQAQVFASAWSLVGSRFDSGDGMEKATEQKDSLKQMVDALKADHDKLKAAAKLALEALEHVQWKNWRTDKAITELLRAGVE